MHSPKLKVCGLTRPEDVALCHALGVDFTGFVMAPESPRNIAPEAVRAMPEGRAKRVGVFTGADGADLERAATVARLDFLQLHGGQDEALCAALGPERVIKVFWPERLDENELRREMDRFAPVCASFLFDAGRGGGGTGRPFSWAVLEGLDIPRPWFLAGGIGPATAAEAAACGPFALDVNSGVERAPGLKDADALRTLLRNLRRDTDRGA